MADVCQRLFSTPAIAAAFAPEAHVRAILQFEAAATADLRPLVASMQVPALIVAAELDQSAPPSQAEQPHAAIAGSELVVRPQAVQHCRMPSSQRPSTRLLQFLNRQ